LPRQGKGYVEALLYTRGPPWVGCGQVLGRALSPFMT
jgi:hypothetical protein